MSENPYEVPIVPAGPEPERFALCERFQRGLLHRGASYALASTSNHWRTGLVGLLRPEGPGEAERLWVVAPVDPLQPMPLPQGPQGGKETALALAVDVLPPSGAAARLEENTNVPSILFSPQALEAGPRAQAGSALAELKATLAYAPEDLAQQSPDQAYARLAGMADAQQFFAALREATPKPWVTQAVIALCVLIWLVQVLQGISPSEPSPAALLSWGGNQPGLSLGSQPWRLLTAGFLHVGILHLALNMYVLHQLGKLGERLFGPRTYLAVYLAAIVGGFLASAVWSPVRSSAGASGGIFGLCGGILGFVLVQREALPRSLFTGVLRTMGLFVIANLGLTLWLSTSIPIDNAGHVGGLIVGFLAGALMSRRLPESPEAERRRLLRLPLLALGLGLLFAIGWNVPSVAKQRAVGGQAVWRAVYGVMDAGLEWRRTPDDMAELARELEELREGAAQAPPALRPKIVAAIDALDALAKSAKDGRAPVSLLEAYEARVSELHRALED